MSYSFQRDANATEHKNTSLVKSPDLTRYGMKPSSYLSIYRIHKNLSMSRTELYTQSYRTRKSNRSKRLIWHRPQTRPGRAGEWRKMLEWNTQLPQCITDGKSNQLKFLTNICRCALGE